MKYIGCQTITWGDMHQEHIEKVFREIKKAGYDGIEIGARRLDYEKSNYYKKLLANYNLKLVGLHIGGDYLNKKLVKKRRKNLKNKIELTNYLNGEFIFISGLYKENKSLEDYKIEANNYNQIGKMCRKNEITLCYHNHNWEFENNLTGFNILIEQTDSENLGFVPDVGWITHAGVNPAKIIKKIYNRVKAIHFKEFTKGSNFTELGKGVVDFQRIYEVIKDKNDFWIVAEQDQTHKTPFESAKNNCQFIQNII